MKLNEYQDNGDEVYRVPIGKRQDIVEPLTQYEVVTKGKVREMFVQFVRSEPELLGLPRDEQVREFNLARRDVGKPKIDPDLVAELEV